MPPVSLSQDAIFRLHPTAVRTDRELVVEAFGAFAARYAPGIEPGRCLTDFFEIVPRHAPDRLARLAAGEAELALVAKDRGIRLSATVLAASEDFLIVMQPALERPGQPTQGLHIADFPPEDPLVQSLLQIALLQCLKEEAETNARDLKLAWEEIGEVLAQMRSITGFMSHEFSNLLSIIQLNCERISPSDTGSADTMRAIALVRQAADRGSSVARWLRALSGDADLTHREPLDDFLRANLPLLKVLCGTDVSVSSRLEAGAACIDAPVCSLLNCLVSIIRAVAAQSGQTFGAHIQTRERPASADGKPMAEIRVSISGIGGIDGDGLLVRSQRSFLGHETGRFSIAGFARSAGGSVRYEAVGEMGGIVSLLIPRTCAAVPALTSTSPDNHKPGGHLVVVEDEPAALEALVELLEFEGYAVTGCSDAEQALAALAARPDSILVTDVVLPKMDGLALARTATGANPELRVIVMSGHVPDPGRYDARWDFVRKPLNVDDLITAIARVHP